MGIGKPTPVRAVLNGIWGSCRFRVDRCLAKTDLLQPVGGQSREVMLAGNCSNNGSNFCPSRLHVYARKGNRGQGLDLNGGKTSEGLKKECLSLLVTAQALFCPESFINKRIELGMSLQE